MNLPSGYIPCNMLGGQNVYFDTGVLPSNEIKIIGLFFGSSPTGSHPVFYFGSRNTNSNTSAGQLNFVNSGQGITAYLGYASARISLADFGGGAMQITKNDNAFDVVDQSILFELTGATTTFTGTRTMYLLALNNAGSVNYGGGASVCQISIAEFSITESGTETHHYVPVYDEANSRFGLYDLVAETFLTKQGTGNFRTHYLLDIQTTTGGDAFIMNDTIGYTTKKYIEYASVGMGYAERLVAFPRPGYEFLNWTDGNGNVLSTETYYEFKERGLQVISADTTITANFVKKTDEAQTNKYQLLGLQYGVGIIQNASDPDGSRSDIYSTVRSFEVEQDITSAATTRLELDDVPSLYQTNMPVFLFTPKGQMIWCGIIQAIEGNSLICREATSLFDTDEFFSTPTASQLRTRVNIGIYDYLMSMLSKGNTGSATDNPALVRKYATLTKMQMNRDLNYYSIYDNRIVFGDVVYTLPSVGTGVSNVEEFLFRLSEEYGTIYEPSLYSYVNEDYVSKGVKHLLSIRYINPSKYGAIQFGTNSEAITNIEIVDKEENANSLMIFDSTGATLRGIYGVKTDGSIEDMSTMTSDFLAYSNCVNKVIASDDSIKALIRENLGNAMMNHKITFDVDLLNNMYHFDDFKLGRRVNFYNGSKVYNSMITALSYAQDNNDDIKSVHVTLGNVRTKLTAKINLAKGM